jgi:hypothetical protein
MSNDPTTNGAMTTRPQVGKWESELVGQKPPALRSHLPTFSLSHPLTSDASAPDQSSKSPEAFASAMRQALNRSCDGRSADAPRSRNRENVRMGEREVQSPKSDVGPMTQDPGVIVVSPPVDPVLAAALAAEVKDEAEVQSSKSEVQSPTSDLGPAIQESGLTLSNIILFPTPSVIIPFPVAIAAGDGTTASNDGFRMSSGTQSGAGNAPVDGGASGNERSGDNIVPLPTAARAAGPQSNAAAGTNARRRNDDEDDGIDILKLGLRPEALLRRADVDNIEAVDFKPAAPTSTRPPEAGSPIVSVAFQPAQPAGEGTPAHPQAMGAPTQLPGEADDPENSAQATETGGLAPKTSPSRPHPGKGPSSTALTGSGPAAIGPAEPAGIPAARQESRMNTLMDARHEGPPSAGALLRGGDAERSEAAFAGFYDAPTAPAPEAGVSIDFTSRTPAMEWQPGRPVNGIDGFAPEFSARNVDAGSAAAQSDTVERISNLVVREAALIRQYKSDALAVVLRPDADTELFVHFSQRNGQIEATIRCERGDAQQLGALWSQLQESLGQQKVRLAPLQESPANPSNFNSLSGSQTGSGSNGSPRHGQRPDHQPDQRFMDEWSVPASPASAPPQERGRAGSGHRRVTTSRPGWETWA